MLILISLYADAYTVYLPIECDITSPNQLDHVDYDLALIRFFTSSSNVSLYGINSNCHKCSPIFLASNNTCFGLWTVHQWTLILQSGTGELLTSISTSFNEFGEYEIAGTVESLTINEIDNGVDSLLPLYIVIFCIVFIVIASFVIPYVMEMVNNRRKQLNNQKSMHNPLDVGINYDALLQSENEPDLSTFMDVHKQDDNNNDKAKSERLLSLDTYRGLSLTLMIFVNYGGGGYWFTDHSPWNGLTIADCLFPSFMFVSGVSLALSMKSLVLKEEVIVTFNDYKKVIRRALILFGLDMFLANGYDYTTWRIPGVLFYFSVSGLVTSLTVLTLLKRTRSRLTYIMETENRDLEIYSNWKTHPSDSASWKLPSKILLGYSYEWIIQGTILLVYLSIALGAKVDGCPRGYNGPGGISEDSAYFNCTGGIHRSIDITVFGYNQIYHHPTCKELYKCIAYDPEGLLGVLSACTLCYLGLMAGRVLIHFKTKKERLSRWFVWSIAFLLLAGILCGFKQNGGFIPVNKNLWSTSFVFVNAGIALFGISICYIVIDIYKVWSGAPFSFLGMNSILIYFCHDVFMPYFPFSYILPNITHAAVLQSNIIGVSSWIFVAYYCYTNNFFVKI